MDSKIKPNVQIGSHIFVYDNILTSQECNEIMKYSKPRLSTAEVLDENGKSDINKEYRIADSYYMEEGELYGHNTNEYPAVFDKVNELTYQLSNVKPDLQESSCITRYKKGGQYKPHFDAIDYNKPKNFNTLITEDGHPGDRTCTVLYYLYDECTGGETIFIHDNVVIKPKQGSAIIWLNYINDKDGYAIHNERSFHAGLPIKSGEKWILTKWCRGPYKLNV